MSIKQRRDVHLLLTAWEQAKARLQVRIGYFATAADEPMVYDKETKRPECLPIENDVVQRALKFPKPYVDRFCDGGDVMTLDKEKYCSQKDHQEPQRQRNGCDGSEKKQSLNKQDWNYS